MNYKTELSALIDIVVKERGSDLHLSAGAYPTLRVDGILIPLTQKPRLSPEDTRGLLSEILNDEQQKRFETEHEIDFSYQHGAGVRFRGNGYVQQGTVSVALRLIASEIRSLQELGLPPILETFTELQQGFFLVVGPVGQGKSTTLAAMVEVINQNRAEHIVTIEDPIEYLFQPKRSLIDQREVRVDSKDFPTALAAAFRQDMDVIMLGEMREP